MNCVYCVVFAVRVGVSRCIRDFSELRKYRNSGVSRRQKALRRKEGKRRPTAIEFRSNRSCSPQARFSVFANCWIVIAQLLSRFSNIGLSLKGTSERLKGIDRLNDSSMRLSKLSLRFETPFDLAKYGHKNGPEKLQISKHSCSLDFVLLLLLSPLSKK